ncbi:MAG: magnesium transporter CorA family protein [Cellulomonas sp.]|nr:magnesium transporter CorA family protein [Cellulomonas sp.]
MSTDGVRTRLWRSGRLVSEGFDLADVSDLLAEPDTLVWVDLCRPDHALLTALAAELSFTPQAVEDAIAAAERPKATRSPGHSLFITYATRLEDRPGAAPNASRLATTKVSAFMMHGGLVTVRSDDGFDMDEVVTRWDEAAELLTHGPAALLYGLLDTVVDGHFATVQQLDEAIEDLEDGLFDGDASSQATQRASFRVRKELVELRRVVLPMREVVAMILRHREELKTPDAEDLDGWYADLYDHVLRVAEWTESLRDMVTTIFETTLALADARLNTIMKKLTAWAAIVAVPTAITGWFGQNLPYFGFGRQIGVWMAGGSILVLVTALYVAFRRRDWL